MTINTIKAFIEVIVSRTEILALVVEDGPPEERGHAA